MYEEVLQGADKDFFRLDKGHTQPFGGDGRRPSGNTEPGSRVGRRKRRGVETRSSSLPQGLSIRKGFKSTIQVVPTELSRKKDKPICFSKRRNYKVFALVRHAVSVMNTEIFVLDSGAGPNLRYIRCLAENLDLAILPVDGPPFTDALSRSLQPLGSVVLFVGVGQLPSSNQF